MNLYALTIFGDNSFIFSFVGYGMVTKSLRVGCTFEEVEEKIKKSINEYESISNQIR
jgi:hypothetical protein